MVYGLHQDHLFGDFVPQCRVIQGEQKIQRCSKLCRILRFDTLFHSTSISVDGLQYIPNTLNVPWGMPSLEKYCVHQFLMIVKVPQIKVNMYSPISIWHHLSIDKVTLHHYMETENKNPSSNEKSDKVGFTHLL